MNPASETGGSPAKLPRALAQAALEAAGSVVFVTDASGAIIWVNAAFGRVTGWSPEEAIGQNPRILQSGLHDKHYYAGLWSEIRAGRSFSARMVNRARNGDLCVVAQTVTPLPVGNPNPTHYVAFQEDVSAEVEHARELEYLAFTDPLTGLGNRRALLERLDEAWRHREPVALLIMDIDDFKGINDRFGHAQGDQALRHMGDVLREAVGGPAAFRLGGDEFVLLMIGDPGSDAGQAEDCAWRIRADVSSRGVESLGHPFSVSVGLALAPRDGRDSSTLLRCADLALGSAKLARSGVMVYSPAMGRAAMRELALRQDLEMAIPRGQLSLAHRPVRALTTGRIVSVQAVACWRHPRHGAVPQEEFLPLAEQTGQMAAVGEWVLKEAIRCHVRNYSGSGVRLAVHIAADQLHDPLFPARLGRLLLAEGMNADLLDIEISGSRRIEERGAGDALGAIRRLGAGVVVDDFASGVAQLGHLADFPVTALKLNRSVVREKLRSRHYRQLLRGVITLAHSAGIRVIGEGVESPEDVEALRSIGCDEGQGYYLGQPGAELAVEAAAG
ncbi:MAG: EAL domain-containing protein [Chloroflexi bacterium]|nr:EAL domain-containing protein [Chloroflexota bacterium]